MGSISGGWRGPGIVGDGLVLYLDAGSPSSYLTEFGTTFKDVSGNGNTGTLTNGPTYSTGSGGTIVFDGVNDYVNVPSFNIASGVSGFTLSAWVYYAAGSGTWPMIICDNGNTAKMLFGVNIGTGHAGFNIYLGGTETANNTAPTANAWYHVVGILDNTGSVSTVNLYVNGFLISTASRGQNFPFPGYSSGTFIGNGSNGGNSYWKGNIAMASIYNRVLSATEVLQNYNASKARFGLS